MKLTPIFICAAIGIPALLQAEDREPWTVKTDTGSLILRRVKQGPPPTLPREKKRESLRERLLGSGSDRPAAAEEAPNRNIDPSAPPPGQQWQYQARTEDSRSGRTTRAQAQRRSRVVEEEAEEEKDLTPKIGGLMQRLKDSAPKIENIPNLPLLPDSNDEEPIQDEVRVIPQGVAATDAIDHAAEAKPVSARGDFVEPPAAAETEEPGRLRSWINRRASLREPERAPEPVAPAPTLTPRSNSSEIVVEVVPLGVTNPGGNSNEVIVEVGPPEERSAQPEIEEPEPGLIDQLRRSRLLPGSN